MNKRLLLLPALICAVIVNAQNINESTRNTIVASTNKTVVKVTISGKITDAKTNDPLPGASIYFADEKTGAIADAAGKYVINNIPDGHHVIEISYSGYATIVEHIELSANIE
jgi:iron complex outermembrane receptor protein